LDIFGRGPIRGIVVLAILFFSLMVKVKRQEALDRSFGHDPEVETSDQADDRGTITADTASNEYAILVGDPSDLHNDPGASHTPLQDDSGPLISSPLPAVVKSPLINCWGSTTNRP
jgi:hypothetical protein